MSKIATLAAIALASTALASCSRSEPEPSVWDEAESGSEAPDNQYGFQEARGPSGITTDIDIPVFSGERAAPGISVTAAPGVAFTYRYAFVLGSDEIAAQQEQHAGACEKLGRDKCRITGMRYKLIDEDRIEAYLQFKLAPELARNFGKEGIASVEDAGGRLIEAVIVGDDAADKIQQSQNATAQLQQRLADLQQQLRRGDLGSEQRRDIERQIAAIEAQLAAQEQTRENLSESLANTPMTYYYRSDEGFSLGSNPIGDAGGTAWLSFSAMIAGVVMVLGIGLPWVLLALALLALWRTAPVRRFRDWVRPQKKPETFGDIA